MVGALSAVFSNDIICLAVAPVLADGCLKRRLDPVPYLLALACSANVGSALTLIGNPQIIQQQLDILGLDYQPEIVDNNNYYLSSKYATAYYELRNRKGLTMMDAVKRISDPNILGPMMVKMCDADAFVSGLTYEFPPDYKPDLPVDLSFPPGWELADVTFTESCWEDGSDPPVFKDCADTGDTRLQLIRIDLDDDGLGHVVT